MNGSTKNPAEASRVDGPTALTAFLDDILNLRLPSQQSADGLLFSGNRQDAVPRALLLDRRITPLERNTWQVLRLMISTQDVTAMPTYEQLSPWLTSVPCAARASHETVARALIMLRLTRWITLARRRRDPKTGRILGNLYVMHDEPINPFEAIQLDNEYLELVSHALTHASGAIRRTALHSLEELGQDPLLAGRVLPSRLDILLQRLTNNQSPATYPQAVDNSDSEEGIRPLLRNRSNPASDTEESPNPTETGPLRYPKPDSTVSTKKPIKEVRTVPQGLELLHLPERFMALATDQQLGALNVLQNVDAGLHQAVINEWDARCQSRSIRNPAGYLFGLIQKALRGEFHPWAGQRATEPTVSESSPAVASAASDPAVAMKHLAHIRKLLRVR